MHTNPSRPVLTFLKSHSLLILSLVLFIILRIPSLFEPHWYGDEGIYASVALALEHGKKLYVDVFDNRLPFIYYLFSLAGTNDRLLIVRIFNLIAGIITMIGIYKVGKRIGLKNALIAVLLVATWLLGTPRLEATIAHPESFFLPMTVWALWFVLSDKPRQFLVAGMLFGASFIVKFHPIFTLIAVGLYLIFDTKHNAKEKLQRVLYLAIGFIILILIVFALLYFNGNLKEAIQYGLFNNTNYVAEYSGEGVTAMTKIIGLIMGLVVITTLYRIKKISSTAFLLLLLLMFDFYAALFSGRKYEHYLEQIIPSVSLLTGFVITFLSGKTKLLNKILCVILCVVAVIVGRVTFYKGLGTAIHMNVPEYYREFVVASLQQHYDPILPFTYYHEPAKLKIAQYITQRYNTKNIFFYSNESWIYDYSHIVPPTFFVAVYHQLLVPNGPQRMVNDLKRSRPQVIAIDKTVDLTTEMKNYLNSAYQLDQEDTYFQYFVPKTKL